MGQTHVLKLLPNTLHIHTLHAKVMIEVQEVWFVVAARQDATEEGTGRDSIASLSGPSGVETEVESVS